MRTDRQPPERASSRRRPARASAGTVGFTLVEMLVVIGIITILLALLTLGVRGLNGSTNRRSAVGTLMGIFDQARGVAISDGRATYVVFVSAPGGKDQSGAGVPARMWGQAYALFEDPVLQDSTTADKFVPQQRSAWLYLPTNVAFKCVSGSDSSPASLTASLPAANDTTKFNVPAAASGVVSLALPYLKFDATGQIVDYRNQLLDPGAAQLRLLLFQGIASAAGTEAVTQRNAADTGANLKYALEEILLKPTTGRAQYTLDPTYNLAATH